MRTSDGDTTSLRISSALLAAATPFLERRGLSPRTAIELFLSEIALRDGMPFPVPSSHLQSQQTSDSPKKAMRPKPARASGASSRSEFLGSLPGVFQATRRLRSKCGRLDARKIAELFGLSPLELPGVLRTAAKVIRQTPDSLQLQPALRQLERCARLLVLNADPDNFRAWLNTSNVELAGATPLNTIRSGRCEIVAHLVEDTLTNRGG